jgi:peptidoglycan hydrolase-like protein with peptidoglycan-binding domain
VVSRGQRGVRVTTVQSLLAARGHRLAADGVFGPATTNAVKAFQRAHRLAPDGTVGPKTWSALIFNLRPGSHGQAVTAAQRLLTGHGHPAAADGDFGPRTTAAVKAFQARHGLSADGVIGPKTWKALVGTAGSNTPPTSTRPVASRGYYLQYTKNKNNPTNSVLALVHDGKVIKSYRIKGHETRHNGDIKGYAIQLPNKSCRPQPHGHRRVDRTELFIHSEMTVGGGQGAKLPNGKDNPQRWDDDRDYKSLGCIKLRPADIKSLFAQLSNDGWRKDLTLRVIG